MFNNKLFFFDFSVYVGEGLSWEWRQLLRGMSFSLTWRVKMRWRQLMWRSSREISSTSRVLSLCFLCPLPTSARCFCLSFTPGIKCKKASSCCFKECFLHFQMVSHYKREFGDGYKWKREEEKKAKMLFYAEKKFKVKEEFGWGWLGDCESNEY